MVTANSAPNKATSSPPSHFLSRASRSIFDCTLTFGIVTGADSSLNVGDWASLENQFQVTLRRNPLSEAAPTATGSLSTALHPQAKAPVVRFVLTETEFKEAAALISPLSNNRYFRIAGRIICAWGTYFFIAVAGWTGHPWSSLVRTNPVGATLLSLLAGLNLYVAVGTPWINALNKRFNRFDLEREITLTDDLVIIRRGPRLWRRKWDAFDCFRENPAIYVLIIGGYEFWTIPKRAFGPGAEAVFGSFLESKLRRK